MTIDKKACQSIRPKKQRDDLSKSGENLGGPDPGFIKHKIAQQNNSADRLQLRLILVVGLKKRMGKRRGRCVLNCKSLDKSHGNL